MPEQWTAEIIGTMHIYKITIRQLADILGVTHEYAGMVLNGKRTPKGAEARFRAALDTLIAEKQKGGSAHA